MLGHYDWQGRDGRTQITAEAPADSTSLHAYTIARLHRPAVDIWTQTATDLCNHACGHNSSYTVAAWNPFTGSLVPFDASSFHEPQAPLGVARSVSFPSPSLRAARSSDAARCRPSDLGMLAADLCPDPCPGGALL